MMLLPIILGNMDATYSCNFLLHNNSVSLGYHNITIQALLNEIVYGEITERIFVFRRMCIFCILVYVFMYSYISRRHYNYL